MKNRSIFKTLLLILAVLGVSGISYGQQKTITGKITEASGTGLPGVTILIEGTETGTISDVEGNYRISASEGDVLVFSFIGFLPQRVTVGAQAVIDVVLAEDVAQLEEIVVIGYGEESRHMLTSSIASVDAKEIEDLQVTDVGNAIQGKSAGVRILSGTGQLGETPTIRIRGGSSLTQNNDPLVIIDGVQRTLEDFNPEDVESIEVLKDAAASAIYGARASNGVLLITTKKGSSGKAKFSVNYRRSYSSLQKKLDLLSAEDYLRIERVGLTRSFLDENSVFGTGPTSTGTGNGIQGEGTVRILAAGESAKPDEKTMIDPVTGETLAFQDNDWQDIVYSTTAVDNLTFSVDGGTDKITYYLGSSFLDQEGIAINTGYKRLSLQSNTTFRVNDQLKFNTNVNFTRSKSNEPFSTGIIFSRGARQAPTARYKYDDGSLAPGFRESFPNVEHYTSNYLNNESINKLTLGGTAEYEITPNLVAKIYGNFFQSQTFRDHFVKSNFWTSTRSASQRLFEQRQSQVEATLRYDKSVGDHNFSALVGTSRLDNRSLNWETHASGGSTDNIQTLNAAPNIGNYFSFKGQDRLISIFGRANYNFSEKYLLSASIRRDGSSRFGANNRAGVFPSFSAGWRISEESFFAVPYVSGLKLRGSWGQTGNNDVPLSGSQGSITAGLVYAGLAGSSAVALANADLGWETTTQTDIGFDLDLLDKRIRFSFDYYKKVTEDMLFPRPLPNTTGFSSLIENIGEAQFTGTEFYVSADIINSGGLTLTTDFNITFEKNEVLKLPENDFDKNRLGGLILADGFSGIGGLAEGEAIGNIYGYRFEKVYSTAQEAQEDGLFVEFANDRTSSNGIDYRERVGGDVKWFDKNGDGIINNEDQVLLGNVTPDKYGGFGNTLTYGSLELYVFMDFALGHHIYNHHFARMNSNSQGNSQGTGLLRKAWNQEGDVTNIPRFVFFDFGNARNHDTNFQNLSGGSMHQTGSNYVEKGNYLALRTVRVSYNLPQELIGRIGLSSAKAYVSGQNLHHFTKYRGYSPEFLGADAGRYPLFRTFSLGLNLGF